MMQNIIKLRKVLSLDGSRNFFILIAATILMSFLDIFSLVLIIPFFQFLSGSSSEISNFIISFISNFGVEETIFFWGILIIFLILLANLIKSFCYFFLIKISQAIRHKITLIWLKKLLKGPYSFFLENDSDQILKDIFSETEQIIVGYVQPLLNLVTNFVSIIIIIITVSVINIYVGIILFSVLTLLYFFLILFNKKSLSYLGDSRSIFNEKRFSDAEDLIRAAANIKISTSYEESLIPLELSSKKFSNSLKWSMVRGYIPRYLLEAFIFSSLVIITLILMFFDSSGSNIFAVVALIGVSGYRLFPAYQALYQAFTFMSFSNNALEKFSEVLETKEESLNPSIAKEFRDVSFSYKKGTNIILEDISIKIPPTGIILIKGKSGSGKTTFLHLLLGLLKQSKGHILREAEESRNFSYVGQWVPPQKKGIYENIANKDEELLTKEDVEKVNDCLSVVNLNYLISEENSRSLRNSRLSGGELQRLNIAKAIFSEPETLILDEPSSALDDQNKESILLNLSKQSSVKRIFIVSHDNSIEEILNIDFTFEIENKRLTILS